MNKVLITVVALATVLAAAPAFALTVDLIADGGDSSTAIPIGTVEVTDDGTDLTIVYTTTGGWELVETHLGINDGIVVKGKGSVKVGQLAIAGEKSGRCFDPPVTTTTYTVALADLNIGPDGILTIAAHAAVRIWMDEGEDEIKDTEDDIYREESAWGDGTEFSDGRDWSMYFEYALPPDLIVSELVVDSLTATTVAYSYTVMNIGYGPADLNGPNPDPLVNVDNVSVQALLSPDDVFNNAGDVAAGGTILGISPLPILYKGDTFSGSLSAGHTGDLTQLNFLTMMVDWGSVIAESDETNNTTATPLPAVP